jgi:acyl carrier protein
MNIMEEKILEILNVVLGNQQKEKITSISADTNLRNDIGLDSLDLAELTVRIESEYGIDIFEDGVVFTLGEIFEKLKNV